MKYSLTLGGSTRRATHIRTRENYLLVQRPNAYFEDNPDIGYIWVFIEFSVSLDLLDERKSYLPLPNVEQFFLRSF